MVPKRETKLGEPPASGLVPSAVALVDALAFSYFLIYFKASSLFQRGL